jgi:hypothetical protein
MKVLGASAVNSQCDKERVNDKTAGMFDIWTDLFPLVCCKGRVSTYFSHGCEETTTLSVPVCVCVCVKWCCEDTQQVVQQWAWTEREMKITANVITDFKALVDSEDSTRRIM